MCTTTINGKRGHKFEEKGGYMGRLGGGKGKLYHCIIISSQPTSQPNKHKTKYTTENVEI